MIEKRQKRTYISNRQNNNAKNKKPVILVCHASTGSGHKSAADSIAQALTGGLLKDVNDQTFRNAEVRVVDVLDYCIVPADGNKAAATYTGKIAPIHDVTWRHNFMGRLLWGGGQIFSAIAFPKFEKLIKETEPLVVICTHMAAANIAGGVRAKLKFNYPIVSVPTDYETEGLWPHKQTDLFCVASDSMVDTLLARKVPGDKIKLTGIPVKPSFSKTFYKKPTRKQLGLPMDKTIAVVIAGAGEPKPYVNFRKSINNVIEYFAQMDWMYFIFCVGRDKEYADELREICRINNITNLTVVEYTNQMPQLISASDIVLCKAGGLTVTECLCCKKPMILVGKAYAQEHINLRYLTYEGVAYHATNYGTIVDILCRITSNKTLYDAAVENGKSIRRPNAAMDVASASLELAGCRGVHAGVQEARRLYRTGQSRKKELIGMYFGHSPAHRL